MNKSMKASHPAQTLTGWNDLEDARLRLPPDHVLGWAQERPVVQVRHGRVDDDAAAAQAHGELLLWHLQALGRVVEPPVEPSHLENQGGRLSWWECSSLFDLLRMITTVFFSYFIYIYILLLMENITLYPQLNDGQKTV